MKRIRETFGLVAITCVMGATAWAPTAAAHGIWAHVHVTGWAIENLPPGDLRDLFADPEVRNAALFGAAFTDSGYWPQSGELAAKSREYSEHTHWEPFIEDFVQWIRANDPPPWTSLASRKRVAFLMGCAAHGLQDEVFDSLMLPQIAAHDAGSQDNADPASDAFLSLDGHIRLIPEPWIPMDTLLELYADLGQPITEDVILDAVDIMTTIYVNAETGPEVAIAFGGQYEPELPWTRDHYLDPEIPGSLRAEILPTLRYLEALWARLHGEFGPDDVVTHTFPEPPRRLLGVDASTPDPWVTFVYGKGVHEASPVASWTADADSAAVGFQTTGTRWGATWTRLHRLQPDADLEPGAWYTVTLAAGLELIDGTTTAAAHGLTFQAPCATPDDGACPDLGELPVPAIDGRVPGPAPAPESEPEPEPEPEPGPESASEPEPEPESESETASDAGGCASGPPSGLVAAALALLWLLGRRRENAVALPRRRE